MLNELADYHRGRFLAAGSIFDKTPRVAVAFAGRRHRTDADQRWGDLRLQICERPSEEQAGAAFRRSPPSAFSSDVGTGYPVLLTEMTILTALRTAATSAMAAKHLAAEESSKPWRSSAMARRAKFQALAFKAVLGIDEAAPLRYRSRQRPQSCAANLEGRGFDDRRLPDRAKRLSKAPTSSPPSPPTSSMRRS
ncbi:MAG: hypothetical protein ACWGHV_08090 [Stutzerimonas stutzeri]